MKGHLALIGDSIFDNAPYVEPNASVTDHIEPLLDGWTISLIAVDGETTREIPKQLKAIPRDCTHLALSIGGNDALQCIPQLRMSCGNVMEALDELGRIQVSFRKAYREVIKNLLKLERPLVVLTIYEEVPGLGQNLKTALSLFNEVILSEAAYHQLAVLDLRQLCRDPADYSSISPIEPSSHGGLKIARALANIVRRWDPLTTPGRLYVR